MLTQPKTETLRKSLSTSIWTTEEKNNILNKQDESNLFTPVLHHPLPQPDHFLKEIYIVTSGIIVIASTWKVLSMFYCWPSGYLYPPAFVWNKLVVPADTLFGGSWQAKQLLHYNPQSAMAWHGKLGLTKQDSIRLEICQIIYTAGFLSQKFYTLKVRKLQLSELKKKQHKCINISYLSRLFVKIQNFNSFSF